MEEEELDTGEEQKKLDKSLENGKQKIRTTRLTACWLQAKSPVDNHLPLTCVWSSVQSQSD